MNDGYRYVVKPFLDANKNNNVLTKMWIGTKLELIELGNVLRDDEQILYLTACKWGDLRILVCITTMRLIGLNKGLVFNKFQESVFLNNIANVSRGRRLFFGNVNIALNNGNVITLDSFWYKDTEEFVHALETAVYNWENARSEIYSSRSSSGQVVNNYYYGNTGVSQDYSLGSSVELDLNDSEDDLVDDLTDDDLYLLLRRGIIDEQTYLNKRKNR